VVATCSYEARKFGVHSAMAMSQALRKCPGLIVLPVRMDAYKQASFAIREIFQEYTKIIEPLSLDEAYLDVSESPNCQGSATLMAEEIRQKIFSSQGLTASAGIASNKFLAKIASDWNKPNGQKVVLPEEVDEFVRDLPITTIFGVGKVTAKRMTKLGLNTCYDLQQLSHNELELHFGSFGRQLYDYCRGIDHRPVQTERIRKSLSIEDTFPVDLQSLEECLLEIPALYHELMKRYEVASQKATLMPSSLFVKIRFQDFETTTMQISASKPDKHNYYYLCTKAWERGKRPVRLIGLGMRFQTNKAPRQLPLFH